MKHRDPSPDRLCIPRDIFVLKPPPNRIEYTHADDSAAVRVVLLPLRFPPALSNLNNGTGGRGGVRNIFIYIYIRTYIVTRVCITTTSRFSRLGPSEITYNVYRVSYRIAQSSGPFRFVRGRNTPLGETALTTHLRTCPRNIYIYIQPAGREPRKIRYRTRVPSSPA